MRYLWLTTFVLLATGVLLIATYLLGRIEVIALIAGVLLIWSAIVKVIVLRIWRWSLSTPGIAEGHRRPATRREQPR